MTRSGGGGIIERKNVLIREKVHSGVSPADAARIAAWGIRLKVLWLCNIMLPVFAKANGLPCTNREGWLSGSFDRIVAARRERERAAAGAENVAEESGSGEHVDDTSDLHLDLPDLNEATGRDALGDEARYIDLAVCCPVPAFLGSVRQEVDGVIFYGFREDLGHPEHYDPGLEEVFADILQDYRPDIVHIFGTEFPHTLAMARAFRNPGRTLIGIQGLCCSIADAYMADLPYRVQRRATFRDRVRRDSLRQQQAKFVRRAAAEAAALRLTGHVTGRTELDRRETGRINPEALYHPMNETMRRPFYAGLWDTDRAEPYSIFVGQGDYPLKGLHYMLQAMPDILAEFPKAKLYVAGISVIGGGDEAALSGLTGLRLSVDHGKFPEFPLRGHAAWDAGGGSAGRRHPGSHHGPGKWTAVPGRRSEASRGLCEPRARRPAARVFAGTQGAQNSPGAP